MIDRFAQLPESLRSLARAERLGPAGTPTLLIHPDWRTPSPVVLWMHGRTAHKELDSGRYLRWLRARRELGTDAASSARALDSNGVAGIATCAIDLPGHGERFDRARQHPERTLDVLEQMLGEIDHVLEALADPRFHGAFDLDRVAIGGMSAGGMVTLRRLCDEHPFTCAAVEGTTGCLSALYADGGPWNVRHDDAQLERLDVERRLALSPTGSSKAASWRAVPLLALHAEHDQIVPVALQRRFIERVQSHYAAMGADPAMAELVTFGPTGAPQEHAGFGRFGNDAKNVQTAFLTRHLLVK